MRNSFSLAKAAATRPGSRTVGCAGRPMASRQRSAAAAKTATAPPASDQTGSAAARFAPGSTSGTTDPVTPTPDS
ncbi:hypothetical protein [Nocardia sp. NBC_00511]|uniref:hypothetical protein n=1 Tax=Nocardia sp. NBC_00511 TaxID=2903591 RepID=UPI0038648E71